MPTRGWRSRPSLRAAGDEDAAAGEGRRALDLYEAKGNQSGILRASAFTGAEPAVTAPDRESAPADEPEAREDERLRHEATQPTLRAAIDRYVGACSTLDWEALADSSRRTCTSSTGV